MGQNLIVSGDRKMFIFTAKVAKEKLVIGILGIAAAVVLLVLMLGGGAEATETEKTTETISTTGISGNDDRLEYINALGWVVEETPVETIEVMIPPEGDKVFDRYNELQMSQGFDLSKFAGKKVKKITYQVLNHPSGEEDVHLTIYTHKKEIIGGDVSSGREGGFMHSLKMPDTAGVTSEEAEATTREALS